MTDIRKDFAEIILFMPQETKEDSVRLIDALVEAAGRAHDVDVLIAEILANAQDEHHCAKIIRKHFGKE